MFRPAKYKAYTSKEIKPTGWLRRQLQIQAESLSGNLYKVWPDIRDSVYVGGKLDSWERVPYWLDGFIPLAYLLEDEEKIAVAKRYIDGILASQGEDGWIGTCPTDERCKYDLWPSFLILKVLTVYHGCSGDERIPDAVYRGLKELQIHIHNATILGWASARWYECLIPIYWLYDRVKEDWLLELGISLYAGGIDYKALFRNGLYKNPVNAWNYESHVVNVAMALKSHALLWQISGDGDREYPKEMLAFLDANHGTATGHFNGDECLSGSSPVQGTELCSVVEAMFSYEQIFAVTGDSYWLERLEKLAYNALPATLSEDMWAHQYDQQVNQVGCVNQGEKSVFRTNGPDAHVFGLEPHFGCCTSNFNQGWPKFALSTFYHSEDTVLCTGIAPAIVNAGDVTVELKTDYPFRTGMTYTVRCATPRKFRLAVRIPGCVKNLSIDLPYVLEDGFAVFDREWTGETRIQVNFEFETRFVPRADMFVLERGPLLYSLEIGEDWKRVEYEKDGVERKYPYCDYEIKPTTAWNYAFADFDTRLVTEEMRDIPFCKTDPPLVMEVNAVQIPWNCHPDHRLVCTEKPDSLMPLGEVRKVKFKPYGCTTLRMTQIPLVKGE